LQIGQTGPSLAITLGHLMSDVERVIVGISIATGILAVTGVVFVLWLPHAPLPLRNRIVARFTKWSDFMERVLERGAYPWAVVMVVFMALTLIGAVAYLFVPR
jgi:hypothetical protein